MPVCWSWFEEVGVSYIFQHPFLDLNKKLPQHLNAKDKKTVVESVTFQCRLQSYQMVKKSLQLTFWYLRRYFYEPKKSKLVGGFNPFETYYSSQIGSFPQVGMKIKKYWKPPPRFLWAKKEQSSELFFFKSKPHPIWVNLESSFGIFFPNQACKLISANVQIFPNPEFPNPIWFPNQSKPAKIPKQPLMEESCTTWDGAKTL